MFISVCLWRSILNHLMLSARMRGYLGGSDTASLAGRKLDTLALTDGECPISLESGRFYVSCLLPCLSIYICLCATSSLFSLSLYLSICLSVCLSLCVSLSVCLSDYLSASALVSLFLPPPSLSLSPSLTLTSSPCLSVSLCLCLTVGGGGGGRYLSR